MITVKELIKLIVSILVCLLAGQIGALATSASIPTWYATLNKPFFTPPNWVFAPVWITLYLLMGIAAFLVWQQGFEQPRVRRGLVIFGIQLILNTLWSIAFFGLQSPLAGLVVIVLLWLAILLTILSFSPISKPAAILLIPYLLWVSLAALLNAAILILN
ncbi:MAG TPA: tryptophan-rich sensory protein [Methanomicrobia archaeon]|nr:tryptophan-rich sensory protein [Methanomicrobia archaeon]